VGDRVRTFPTVNPKQWAGRCGFVASLNRRDGGELGVSFVAVHDREQAGAWFVPGELVSVDAAHSPQDRPGRVLSPKQSTGSGPSHVTVAEEVRA
jgi:hypothetical protein